MGNLAPIFTAALMLVPAVRAADPTLDNVQALLDLTKTCNQKLSGPYAYDGNGPEKVYICGDKKDAVYWTADMDIDCDGAQTPQCNPSTDAWWQNETSYGTDVDAANTPYFVIPSDFDLAGHGIDGGQIAAVIYKGKLTYAVFADTGPATIIGEGSFGTAKLLNIPSDPDTGGTDGPVTFIVFTGTAARAAITPAGHQDALAKGAQAAAKFIQDNGGTVGVGPGCISAPEPGQARLRAGELRWTGRSLEVTGNMRHSLRALDARGREARSWRGNGPAEYSLQGLKAGVYRVEADFDGVPRAR